MASEPTVVEPILPDEPEGGTVSEAELYLGVSTDEDSFEDAISEVRRFRQEIDNASGEIKASFEGGAFLGGVKAFVSAIKELIDFYGKIEGDVIKNVKGEADDAYGIIPFDDLLEMRYNLPTNKIAKEYGVTPDNYVEGVKQIAEAYYEVQDLGQFNDQRALNLDQALHAMGITNGAAIIQQYMVDGGPIETLRQLLSLISEAAYAGNTEAQIALKKTDMVSPELFEAARMIGATQRHAGTAYTDYTPFLTGSGATLTEKQKRDRATQDEEVLAQMAGEVGTGAHSGYGLQTLKNAAVTKFGGTINGIKRTGDDLADFVYYKSLVDVVTHKYGTQIANGSGTPLLTAMGLRNSAGSIDSEAERRMGRLKLSDETVYRNRADAALRARPADAFAQMENVFAHAEGMINGNNNLLTRQNAIMAMVNAGTQDEALRQKIVEDLSSKTDRPNDKIDATNLFDVNLMSKLLEAIPEHYDVNKSAMAEALTEYFNAIVQSGDLQKQGETKLGVKTTAVFDKATQEIRIQLETGETISSSILSGTYNR